MARLIRLFAAILMTLAGVSFAGAQTPEPRIALVIGNSAYRAGSLATPANDAGLVAQTLTQAGFAVIGARDLDQDGLRRSFRDFLEKAASSGPDTVAFVYLAGYGVQYAGENYFAPIEATMPRDSSVPLEALRVADLTRALADIPLKARFVVLDAARANPFAPTGQPLAGGLALVEPEEGSFVAFNAAPGVIPPQATGDYGPYARALAEMMQQGGLDADEVFARTRLRVSDETRGAQVPWNASRLKEPVVFFERADDAPPPVAQAPRNRAIRDLPVADAYVMALERDTIPAYEEFLVAYPRDPLSRRVEAMLAARREALTWRRAVSRNTPDAYWSYIKRYPRGPHLADAHRRLAILSAAFDPPPVFDEYDFDVPPPPPDEYEYVSGPVMFFDDAYYAPPPPAPIYFLPPQPREYIELAPPRLTSTGFLPIPVPIFRPSARPWRNDVYRQPPPPRLPTGVSPRDPGTPQRFVAPQSTRLNNPTTRPALQQPNVQQQIAPVPNQQRIQPALQTPQVSPLVSPQRAPAISQQPQVDPRRARQQQELQRRQQLQTQQLQTQRDQQLRIQQQRDQMRNQQVQQQRDRQMRVQQQRDQQVRSQQQLQQQRNQQFQRDQQARGQQMQQQQRQRDQQQRAQQYQQQQQRQQQMQQQQRQQQMQQQQQMRQQQMQQQQMRQQQMQQQQQQRQQQMQQQQMRQQQMQQQQMQRQQQMQQQQQRQQQQQQQQQQRPQRSDCGFPGKPPCR